MAYTITSIAQAKKREDKVNIFLDGSFWIGLTKNDLIKLGLYKNKEISEEEKITIEITAQHDKLLEKVYNWQIIRPRSKQEVREYLLYKQELPKEETEKIIEDLESKGRLSDKEFAKWYVDTRLSFGVHGVNKIKGELAKKGVSSKIITEALNESIDKDTQLDKAKAYLQKVKGSIKAKDKFDLKDKLLRRLIGRGFTYEEASKAIKES